MKENWELFFTNSFGSHLLKPSKSVSKDCEKQKLFVIDSMWWYQNLLCYEIKDLCTLLPFFMNLFMQWNKIQSSLLSIAVYLIWVFKKICFSHFLRIILYSINSTREIIRFAPFKITATFYLIDDSGLHQQQMNFYKIWIEWTIVAYKM